MDGETGLLSVASPPNLWNVLRIARAAGWRSGIKRMRWGFVASRQGQDVDCNALSLSRNDFMASFFARGPERKAPRLSGRVRLARLAGMAFSDDPSFELETELWRWTPEPPARASWYFVTITGAAADAIRALGFERRALGGARGFGSVRVRASVDGVTFETSAFPHASSGGYVLPVKAAVRKSAGVGEGDRVTLGIWA